MRYDLLFIGLAIGSILLGMAAKNQVEYAPMLGWILSFFFFIMAIVSVIKSRSRNK